MSTERVIESRPLRGRPRVFVVARSVVLIVATATVLTDLIQVVTIITGRTLFSFGGADPRLPLSYLPQLLQADLHDEATGTLAEASILLRIVCALPSLIHAVTIVLATIYLLRALRGIAQAQPFHPVVLTSWRHLSIVLLVGGLVQALVDTIAVVYLSTGVGLLYGTWNEGPDGQENFLGGDYQGISIDLPQWPFTIIIAGLVALALTAAFRAGARLEKDADGVV